MSKKRDPIVTIVEYFNTAELPLAEQALALAKATVARRRPRANAAKPRKVTMGANAHKPTEQAAS